MKTTNKKIWKHAFYLLNLVICMFSFTLTFGQSYTFTGTVKEAKTGDPLIGASIFIEKSNYGAEVDFDGNYLLKTNLKKGNYTLKVSLLGFVTKRIKLSLDTENNIRNNFILSEDILSLDEVVVTGSTTGVNKRKLGNAISSVKSDDLVNGGAIAADQAISGKVTGALVSQNSGDPAGGISIRLRGASTVMGSSDPLYIIDGIIVSNNSSQLIDLGGGSQNRMADINPNDIDRIEVIKGAAAAAIYGSRASNGVVQIFTKSGKQGKAKFSYSSNIKVHSLRKKMDYNTAQLIWEDPKDNKNLNTIPAVRYDMQDLIFDTAIGSENFLSVNGANEKTSYYLSMSHLNNGGIIKNTDFKRSAFKINLKQKAWDWLNITSGLNYTRSTSSDIPNGGINEFYGALTGFIFGNNVNNPQPKFGVYPKTGLFANPLEVVDQFDFSQNVNRVITSVGFDAKISENLSANYKLGIDYYNHSGKIYLPVGNTANGYGRGYAKRADLNNFQYNSDLNLIYQTDLSDAISSTTTLGGSYQYENAESIGITAKDLPPVVKTASTGNTMTQIEYRSQLSFWGGFLQQSFDFNNKLYINGALRMDGASSFGLGNRNQLYAKASASYIMSQENFWNETFGDKFNALKLRLSWGQAGNLTALGAFERYTLYNTTSFNGINGLVPGNTKGNENISPERQDELEFGFDASFLQNRISVEFTYYHQKVSDLLLKKEYAPSKGYSSGLENVGNLENKGVELLLKGSIIKSENLSWDLSASYSKNENKVTKVTEGGQFSLPGSFGVNSVIQDQPIGVFYGFFYKRNEDGSIALDENGYPSKGETEDGAKKKIIGDPNPDWFGSLINEVKYKNLSLRVQVDAVQGFDVFNWNNRMLNKSSWAGGAHVGEELRGERTKGYGDKEFGIYEAFIEDGSFVKLREVSLSYNFVNPIEKVDNITFSLIGRNLMSFDNYSGWDPEVTSSGQSNGVRGFDIAAVPIPRTIQFGVNVKF